MLRKKQKNIAWKVALKCCKLADMLMVLLLDAEYVLKKTEYRILLSASGLDPSTNGKDLKMTGAENPSPSNFRRLVMGCIEAKFCKKIFKII